MYGWIRDISRGKARKLAMTADNEREVMEDLGLPHEYFATGDAIAEKYPVLEGCKGRDYSGVYEGSAGHIRATKGKSVDQLAGVNREGIARNSYTLFLTISFHHLP
mmetsp:Transcript_6225/g.15648  ORF Transcript_6225/g.15648 Transcript_6225/m.15648 type:complete len:106 (-) Transcript_6225:2987-3304(-)